MTLDAALTDHSDAELLILMGDLCHHGEPVAYQRVARSLSKVSMPVIQMMGNHDRREAFLASFPNAPQTQAGHIQSNQRIADHHVITLDTLDGPPHRQGHHSGKLCADRLAAR